MPKTDQNLQVRTLELAEALGLTKQRINQLSQSGVLSRVKDADGNLQENTWHLPTCVKEYLEFRLRSTEKSANSRGLNDEKLRLLIARTDQARIRATNMKDSVEPSEVVETGWEDLRKLISKHMRSYVLTVSGKLVNRKVPAEVNEILEKDLHQAIWDFQADFKKLQEEGKEC
jgi:phage terminase Nu1 subunit (DNA packaging protein)